MFSTFRNRELLKAYLIPLISNSTASMTWAIEVLLEGRTAFVIAHRLSTVRNADKIVVISHGEIVEEGNHNELMAKGGLYSQLYMMQFRDIEVEETPVPSRAPSGRADTEQRRGRG